MSPEQRRKDLADSEEEMWRVLLMLGMSRETVERTIEFKNNLARKEEASLPTRRPPRPRGMGTRL